MKQIFLAIVLITASWQAAVAQSVSKDAFTSKVNQMDAYIGTGDIAKANTTFDEVQKMMRTVLHDNKMAAANATTDADKNARLAAIQNQGQLFNQIWKMKSDLATNRAAIHSRLESFEATLQ